MYGGPHREALNRRSDWFERTARPGHALWWIPDGAIPTWRDGVSRLEHLGRRGPTPHAFTFPRAFAPDGTPGGAPGGPRSGDRSPGHRPGPPHVSR